MIIRQIHLRHTTCPGRDPFDAHQDAAVGGDIPLVLDNLPGCQYRMTSYNPTEVADIDPAHMLQLHHPRFLEYVGAPESAGLLSHPPENWINTMDREEAVSAALQLQHDAGLIMSNLQVLGQFVMSFNRMSSEVMRLAFGQEQFPRRYRLFHHYHVFTVWHITWQPWGSGVRVV